MLEVVFGCEALAGLSVQNARPRVLDVLVAPSIPVSGVVANVVERPNAEGEDNQD